MASVSTTRADSASLQRDAPSVPAQTSIAPKGIAPARPVRKAVANWACLLLSEDPARLRTLSKLASDAGWDPIECNSVGEALRDIQRWRAQLSIIDLGSMPIVQKASYMQFADRITTRERLLLICDEPSDASRHEGELLARQAGAWMYLPSPDLADGFANLLREARGIAEKIAGDSLTGV